eukprot:gene2591-5064_t
MVTIIIWPGFVSVSVSMTVSTRQFGETPLMTAAEKSHLSCLVMLLDKGADVTIRRLDGKTALDMAIIPSVRAVLIEAEEKAKLISSPTASATASTDTRTHHSTNGTGTMNGNSPISSESLGAVHHQHLPDPNKKIRKKRQFIGNDIDNVDKKVENEHVTEAGEDEAEDEIIEEVEEEVIPVVMVGKSRSKTRKATAVVVSGTKKSLQLPLLQLRDRTGKRKSQDSDIKEMKENKSKKIKTKASTEEETIAVTPVQENHVGSREDNHNTQEQQLEEDEEEALNFAMLETIADLSDTEEHSQSHVVTGHSQSPQKTETDNERQQIEGETQEEDVAGSVVTVEEEIPPPHLPAVAAVTVSTPKKRKARKRQV